VSTKHKVGASSASSSLGYTSSGSATRCRGFIDVVAHLHEPPFSSNFRCIHLGLGTYHLYLGSNQIRQSEAKKSFGDRVERPQGSIFIA